MHMIAPDGDGGFRFEPTQGAYVGHQLPDLISRDLTAKGRHAIGATLDDAGENVLGGAAVDPFMVQQWRSDATPAMEMAPYTVEPCIEAFPFGDAISISRVRVLPGRDGSH